MARRCTRKQWLKVCHVGDINDGTSLDDNGDEYDRKILRERRDDATPCRACSFLIAPCILAFRVMSLR